MKIKVQAEPFDAGTEIAALHAGNPAVGAVTSFTGYCRDEGGQLEALELEHFPGMAESQLTSIAQEANERWPLQGITIIHRYGKLKPGEPIVLVVTASAHRRASFEAADFFDGLFENQSAVLEKRTPSKPLSRGQLGGSEGVRRCRR